MIKQTVTYGVWTINRHDDNKMEVLKNSQVCDNTKAAMREIAAEVGLEVNPDWTTRSFGANLIKAIEDAGGSAPKTPAKAVKTEEPKPAKTEVSKEKKAVKSDNAELEAAKAEIEELKAEIKRLKAELAKAGKTETPKEEKKSKSKDPFEGLMVKVCAGRFNQRYDITESYYPEGDRRKKLEYRDVAKSRQVTISKEYQICKYPVTQAQWKMIMGEGFNMSKFKGDDLPVTNIEFDDIMLFIEKLNKLTGKKYRLPTEAEWVWAAMGAGKDNDQGKYAGCDKEEDLGDYAWYKENSELTTHPVGKKKPNELGLYDMCGNVWECCQDNYRRDFSFGAKSVIDPIVTKEDDNDHICRGGYWYAISECCIIQRWRNNYQHHSNDSNNGFRLAL